MKLAEALILRADIKKRIQQLRERLLHSVRVQEGDSPPEDPQALLAELGRTITDFTDLVRRINATNAATVFRDIMTLTDALAQRDSLAAERKVLADTIDAAVGKSLDRYRRYSTVDVKYFRTISVSDLQKRADDLARQYRELDTQIQQTNWTIDLQ